MPKNILIYSDGTGRIGGLRPEQDMTNIYKMYRASKVSPDNPIDPKQQVAFYDSGLGTEYKNSILSKPFRLSRKVMSMAFGIGIRVNIIDCYEAVLKYYEHGDRVYLFGFSRGAYTARCVANVMNLCGVPQHDATGKPLPKYGAKLRAIAEEAVSKVYEHGASKKRGEYEDEREELARRFRKKYGSEGRGWHGESQGNVQLYFIGVFDTVASLGVSMLQKILLFIILSAIIAACLILPQLSEYRNFIEILLLFIFFIVGIPVFRNRFHCISDFPRKGDFSWHITSWGLKWYDNFLDNLVPYARHAISIDEKRKNYQRVGWGSKKDFDLTKNQKPSWLKQVWFSGNHSDIGGGYHENESRLSDITLKWMLEQVDEVQYPNTHDEFPVVFFNRNLLNLFPDPHGMQHCEVEALRDSLWPVWWPERWRWSWPVQVRQVSTGQELHHTVLERFQCDCVKQYREVKPYRPDALSTHDKVKKYYA